MLDQWVKNGFVRRTLCSGLGVVSDVLFATMSLAYDAERRRSMVPGASPQTAAGRFARQASSAANTITASQARAARQREARRDEQAVAAWLRELAGRPR
jgi:hypothetical protein